MRDKRKDTIKILSSLTSIMQLGLTMTIIIVGCIWMGNKIDTLLGSNPVGLIIFTLLGVASAFYYIFKIWAKNFIGNNKK